MILGLGLDVCEVARVRRSIERNGDRFIDEILTSDEREYCERRKDTAVPIAGRFAAKEAAIKALGSPQGLRWHDMRVIPAEGGPPRLELGGAGAEAAAQLGVERIHLTITHDAGVAAAVVILEGA
ncbi:MAG: holo-ACP synthase [Polyangiales bacterium]